LIKKGPTYTTFLNFLAHFFTWKISAYPEGHIENPDKEQDLLYLKEKVDAGANYIVTQLFYDVNLYLDWIRKVRDMGIIVKTTTCLTSNLFIKTYIGVDVPILPGIMPIQSYGGFIRMTTLCKTYVPSFIMEDLEPIKVFITASTLFNWVKKNLYEKRTTIKLSKSTVFSWLCKCATA
jgi:5,10-methylenetetrahydrofolate reductase